MCNLYSITTSQDAIRRLFGVASDSAGNLPPMPGVFPDYPAPVVRDAGAERDMVMMRWGMPPPSNVGGPPVTNIRNTTSPHWRGWLRPESRCLVPANSFAEYAPEPNPATGKKDVVWFALNDDRPLCAFAGIWTEFKGDRGTKSKPIPGPPPGLRLSDDGTERDRRTDTPQGDAGDPDDRGRARRLDARAVGRSDSAATAIAGPGAYDRLSWRRQGRSGSRVIEERGWARRFEEPIKLPDGRALATLRQAGDYITELPKATHTAAE